MDRETLEALLNKTPTFDPHWPDEVREGWIKWARFLRIQIDKLEYAEQRKREACWVCRLVNSLKVAGRCIKLSIPFHQRPGNHRTTGH